MLSGSAGCKSAVNTVMNCTTPLNMFYSCVGMVISRFLIPILCPFGVKRQKSRRVYITYSRFLKLGPTHRELKIATGASEQFFDWALLMEQADLHLDDIELLEAREQRLDEEGGYDRT